jgi:hypothetical protein
VLNYNKIQDIISYAEDVQNRDYQSISMSENKSNTVQSAHQKFSFLQKDLWWIKSVANSFRNVANRDY